VVEHNYFWKYSYTLAFIFISVTVLLTISFRSISGLAKLEKWASGESQFLWKLMGLLVSIQVYYYYRIDAIIPTMIIISLSSFFLFAFYFSKKK
jgi:PST family polysaccharide transporter